MTPAQERLVVDHLDLTRALARNAVRRLPRHVDIDALMGAADEALVRSATRFDPGRGFAFSSYLTPRVRGAVLDELRHLDPNTRSDRDEGRAIATVSLQSRGTPTDDDTDPELGDTIAAPGDMAEEALARVAYEQALESAFLTERERRVVVLLDGGVDGREIAEAEGVTEGRVSQIKMNASRKIYRGLVAA